MPKDYIDPADATKIRIHDDGTDCWNIDAVHDSNNYFEFVWTHYNDKELTKDEAILRAPEFAQYIGRPDLADKLEITDSD